MNVQCTWRAAAHARVLPTAAFSAGERRSGIAGSGRRAAAAFSGGERRRGRL